jgi:hypothetical protein
MLPRYERLGLFYLGRRYDLTQNGRSADLVLYDSKDLVTHAVCVGMTGSGKTGLGIILMEEAALDGVPVLAIDPKGDLSNLLLTFPALTGEAFAPWVDAGEARARQMTPEALASEAAAAWKAGLAEWDQDEARIARLKAAAEVRVYTPGSRAGVPLSLLNAFGGRDVEAEERPARAATVAASLLSLAGFGDAAPHNRAQALLTAILSNDPVPPRADLPWLVQQIQRPAMTQVGVLDLETFYPAKERQDLALRFNSVLAAPGFEVWSAGEPLDLGRMLYAADGRPRIAIVSVAHLDDSRRMMAVSLVLNEIVEWSRAQGGTASLRAMIYMDEVFGYLPPVANPPSKLPLLTLLKQARASGVGLVLATQNPVDLDYKALSNSGTWFLGKLQTERDKARLLDGLRSVSSGLTSDDLDRTLSALRKRVFLMHNVHEQAPVTFETRWTLSYLRGPLTRDELRQAVGAGEEARVSPVAGAASGRPIVPTGVEEHFLPATGTPARYAPVLYGSARVHYTDSRRGVDVTSAVHTVTPFTDGPVPIDWSRAEDVDVAPEALAPVPASSRAEFAPLPVAALNAANYKAWTRAMETWITRERPLRLFAVKALRLHSRPGETEAEFMARVHHASREARDEQVEALRHRYGARIARAREGVERASEAIGREEQQAQQQKMQTAVSFGATLLGALLGRKSASLSTLGRATTAARGASRTAKEIEDVGKAREKLHAAEQALAALEQELEEAIDALATTPAAAAIEAVAIKPARGGVEVRLVALAWKPE